MSDISIVVPIYNAEKYIKRCLDSIIAQTHTNIEIILINDGSTDNTEKIIKKYKDKRIKYYKNSNKGIGKSRNFGIDISSGKYIMFIDSDDYICTNACEELFNEAEKSQADLVICDFYRVFDNKEIQEKIMDFEQTDLNNKPELILDINLSPWNKLYLNSMIKKNKIRFIENLKYEDAPFVLDSLKAAKKISKVSKPLNYYVIHNNSETTIMNKKVFDILQIVDICRKKFLKEDKFLPYINKLTVRVLTNYTIQQRMQKNRKIRNDFITEVFMYLKENVPDYKKNVYYKDRGLLRRTIEKNKLFTKIYCDIYSVLKK